MDDASSNAIVIQWRLAESLYFTFTFFTNGAAAAIARRVPTKNDERNSVQTIMYFCKDFFMLLLIDILRLLMETVLSISLCNIELLLKMPDARAL